MVMAIGKVSGLNEMRSMEYMRERQRKQAEEKKESQNSGNVNVRATDMQDAKVKQYEESIKRLEQNIQDTNKDAGLTEEEKRKKRMELQQELAELNRQLEEAQRQAEKNKDSGQPQTMLEQLNGEDESQQKSVLQEQAEKEPVFDDKDGQLSGRQMQAMIVGSNAVEQATRLESTATQLENRMRVLGSEISIDSRRGMSVEEKEKEQEKLSARLNQVRENTGRNLGNAKKKAEQLQEEEDIKRENVRFIQSQEQAKTQMPVFQLQI